MLHLDYTIPGQLSVPVNGSAAVSIAFDAYDDDPLLAEGSIKVAVDWGDGTSTTAGPTQAGVNVAALVHSYPQGIYFITLTAANFRSPVPDELSETAAVAVIGPPPAPAKPAPVIFGPILPRDSGFPSADNWDFNSAQDLVVLESDIKMLLSTRLGERLMLPQYGTNLHSLIFQPDPRALTTLVQSEVQAVISRWEPRVSVIAVNAVSKGKTITVAAAFRSLLNQQAFSTSVTLSA